MVTYISFNEEKPPVFVTVFMRPVICFQRNKRWAETMDARLLPVDVGKEKRNQDAATRARRERKQRRESERARSGGGIRPFLHGGQIVVEIPCRNFNFKLSNSKASTPIRRTRLSR